MAGLYSKAPNCAKHPVLYCRVFHWYVFLYVRDKELCKQLQYLAGVADLSKTKAPYISFSFELSLTSFSMVVVNHFIILPRGLRPCSLYLSLQSTSLLWMWICAGMCGGNSLISPSPLSPYLTYSGTKSHNLSYVQKFTFVGNNIL